MINNFDEAKKYTNKIKKKLITNALADQDGISSLKYLAEAEDEKRFRIVVELITTTIKTHKNLELYKKDPLAFIEFLCMFEDSGEIHSYNMFQAGRGLKVKKIKIGKTQRFFQKIYGSHFFKNKEVMKNV